MTLGFRDSVAAADLADWVTVLAYLASAVAAARAAFSACATQRQGERLFWQLTAGLMVLLGVNELLDLQTLLSTVGRDYARANGWYEHRRQVQYAFLLALGLVAIAFGLALLWLTRRMHTSVQVALAGLVFIGVFILLRAASFHHLDDLLGQGWRTFNYGSLQELLGIAIIGVAAQMYRPPSSPRVGVAKRDGGWHRGTTR